MANRDQVEPQRDIYQIVVEGQLDPSWSTWFEALEICHVESEVSPVTVIAGPFGDQAALRGVLTKLWDLRLTLISVIRIDNTMD